MWVQLAPVTRQSCTNKAAARQVRCCKFSRDDTVILSGGFDRRAVAWVPAAGDPHNQNQKNPQSWERAGTVYECARGITTCAISIDGMVAITGAWDGSLRLHPWLRTAWPDGRCLRRAERAAVDTHPALGETTNLLNFQ